MARADFEPLQGIAACARQQIQRHWPQSGLVATTSAPVPASSLDVNEAALAEHMSEARLASFTAGRAAMRRALQSFGRTVEPVGRDLDGVPLLPAGTTGSITHKHGHALAIAGQSQPGIGVGVDLEWDVREADEADLQSVIAGRNEVAALAALQQVLSPSTVVLAAKEAVYKAVFPTDRTFFDFDDIALDFSSREGVYRPEKFPGSENWSVFGSFGLSRHWIVSIAVAKRL